MRLRSTALALLVVAGCTSEVVHGLPPPDASAWDAGTPTDADLPPDTTCASVRFTTTLGTPNVILLVDRSGSMGDVFDRGLSRWTVLQNAIIGSPSGLVPRLQSSVRFGLALFDGEATCPNLVTFLPPALEDYGMLSTTYRAYGPIGSTPTGAALSGLVTLLSRSTLLPGPNIIILATDGEPNDCSGSGSTVAGQYLAVSAAAHAHALGYTVDAIGVATDVALANLQAVATAGGGTAVSVTNTASLSAALDDIVRGAASCMLTLSGRIIPALACNGDVELNGAPLACGDPNGWHAVDSGHIALDGTACDALQHPPAAVTATFPCAVILDPTH